MCQHCKRFGTTLVSYPWPSEPLVIEALPPMSQEMVDELASWNKMLALLRQTRSVGVPLAALHGTGHYPLILPAVRLSQTAPPECPDGQIPWTPRKVDPRAT